MQVRFSVCVCLAAGANTHHTCRKTGPISVYVGARAEEATAREEQQTTPKRTEQNNPTCKIMVAISNVWIHPGVVLIVATPGWQVTFCNSFLNVAELSETFDSCE